MVLIKKQYFLTNISCEHTDWGELISFILGGLKVFCIYRAPSTPLRNVLPLFSESVNTNARLLYCGDFNFQLSLPDSSELSPGHVTSIKDCHNPPTVE